MSSKKKKNCNSWSKIPAGIPREAVHSLFISPTLFLSFSLYTFLCVLHFLFFISTHPSCVFACLSFNVTILHFPSFSFHSLCLFISVQSICISSFLSFTLSLSFSLSAYFTLYSFSFSPYVYFSLLNEHDLKKSLCFFIFHCLSVLNLSLRVSSALLKSFL